MSKERYTVTTDTSNKDIPENRSKLEAREYYLNMYDGFTGKMGDPIIEKYEDKYIFRADKSPGGLKSFGAERIIAESEFDTFVYCAPRQGHAADAIATLAKMYNKKVVFFCPSSKQVSDHQGALFAYDHVDVRFVRIAAMPVLNSYAKKWAERNNAQFLPFGLSGNPYVTAGLINAAKSVTKIIGHDPSEIHCAVSTGTMIRALQIGWPDATPVGVAVARNMHPGEIGDAIVKSATMPFLRSDPIHKHMPFPTTSAYDAKAWEQFKAGKPKSIFINVGSDAVINRNLADVDIAAIDSYRDWGDMRDVERGMTL